jgi:HK97 family phage portal protein
LQGAIVKTIVPFFIPTKRKTAKNIELGFFLFGIILNKTYISSSHHENSFCMAMLFSRFGQSKIDTKNTLIPSDLKRSASIENPNTSFNSYFQSSSSFGRASSTGDGVTFERALQLSVVFSIIRVISEDLASLSYNIIHNKDGENLIDKDYYLNRLINKPNEISSGFHFREAMAMNVVGRGNAYGRIYWDNRGRAAEIEQIENDRVQVEVTRVNGRKQIFYHIAGDSMPLMAYEMLHYKGLSTDGVVGLSPISILRNTIGENISAQEFSQEFYDGGARLSGVLTADGVLSDEAYHRLITTWREKHEGRNAQKTALLEGGVNYQPISLSPVDADILKTRTFGIEEIARPFRVPLHMVQQLANSTNNNIEHQGLEYVKYCLRPWAKRFEVEDNTKLILPKDQSKQYFEFNMESLLRGDTAARVEYLSKMFNIGVYSQDDIRAILKEPKIGTESSQAYYTPVNLMNREKETLKSEDKNTDAA